MPNAYAFVHIASVDNFEFTNSWEMLILDGVKMNTLSPIFLCEPSSACVQPQRKSTIRCDCSLSNNCRFKMTVFLSFKASTIVIDSLYAFGSTTTTSWAPAFGCGNTLKLALLFLIGDSLNTGSSAAFLSVG